MAEERPRKRRRAAFAVRFGHVFGHFLRKLDLAIGVSVGSSTQIALFVVPVAVLSGWYFDTPMSLNFRLFDMACQMLSASWIEPRRARERLTEVFLVSQVTQHGNTNWLHGAMLVTTYVASPF